MHESFVACFKGSVLLSFIVAVLVLLPRSSNLFDNAVYVVLFVAYLPYDLTPLEQWYIKAAVILVVMALNLRGLEAVTAVSVVLTMAVCAPFLIMFAARVSDVRPIQWLYLPSENHVIAFEDIDFGYVFSFVSPLLLGGERRCSAGHTCGEVMIRLVLTCLSVAPPHLLAVYQSPFVLTENH